MTYAAPLPPNHPLSPNFAAALDPNRDLRLAEEILVWAALNYGADNLDALIEIPGGAVVRQATNGLYYAVNEAGLFGMADEACDNIWTALTKIARPEKPPPLHALDYPLKRKWPADEFYDLAAPGGETLHIRPGGYRIEYALRYYQLCLRNIFLDRFQAQVDRAPDNAYILQAAAKLKQDRDAALFALENWRQLGRGNGG